MVRKPCRASWKVIAVPRRKLKITITIFHRTSTRTTPQKSPFPFGIRKTVSKATSSARRPSQKAACTRSATLSQFVASGVSSLFFASIHPDVPYVSMMPPRNGLIGDSTWTNPPLLTEVSSNPPQRGLLPLKF